MPDNFDDDDEYGKTVMMPSPFAEKPKASAEQTKSPEAKPARPAVRTDTRDRQRKTPSRPKLVLNTPRAPKKRSRRRWLAPVIAVSVLFIGAAAAFALFLGGDGSLSPATPPPPSTPQMPKVEPSLTPSPMVPAPSLPAPSPVALPEETKVQKPKTQPPLPRPLEPSKSAPAEPHAAVGSPPVKLLSAPQPRKPPADLAEKRKKAFLMVTSQLVGVKVLVDGAPMAETPLGAPIEVPPGGRFVTLIAPNGQKKGFAVDVEDGDTYNLNENF